MFDHPFEFRVDMRIDVYNFDAIFGVTCPFIKLCCVFNSFSHPLCVALSRNGTA